MRPQRIQLQRTKGWRMPEGAVVVSRPGPWGDPFTVRRGECVMPFDDDWGEGGEWHVMCDGAIWSAWNTKAKAVADAVRLYRWRATEAPGHFNFVLWKIETLAGHDLACWCPLDQPCHADVLLELANGGTL